MKAGDQDRVKTLRGEVRAACKSWMAFLNTNKDAIRGAETNPLGIPVAFAGPISNSLKAVLKVAG